MRIIFIFVILFIGCETDRNVSIQLAHQSLGDPDVLFLDVRTRQEFINEGRIKDALLIPVNDLKGRLDELKQYENKKIIVYCRSGRRSQIATDMLIRNNFNAYNMVGGFLAWKDHKNPS